MFNLIQTGILPHQNPSLTMSVQIEAEAAIGTWHFDKFILSNMLRSNRYLCADQFESSTSPLPTGIWTVEDWVVQIPSPGAKKPFKFPTS